MSTEQEGQGGEATAVSELDAPALRSELASVRAAFHLTEVELSGTKAELRLAERRNEFRARVLETFVLYLAQYEMPADRVRVLLGRVEEQALSGFGALRHHENKALAALALGLLERLLRCEAAILHKLEKTKEPGG